MSRTKLYDAIDYTPKDERLFQNALTHSSCKFGYNNERMEFLGDAILELMVSERLFHEYPQMEEGALTRLRADLVCEQALVEWAKHISLGKQLIIGKGEEKTRGREKPSILCDAVEAVLCAVYLDGGFDEAKKLVNRMIDFLLALREKGALAKDAKTALQEILQKTGLPVPKYDTVQQFDSPNPHAFSSQVASMGKVIGSGVGHSKKAAEQNAARDAMQKMKNEQ